MEDGRGRQINCSYHGKCRIKVEVYSLFALQLIYCGPMIQKIITNEEVLRNMVIVSSNGNLQVIQHCFIRYLVVP